MTVDAPLATLTRGTLRRWLPRSLEVQLLLLTTFCLVISILGYGYYTARQQTDNARRTVTAQLSALAQNLATVDAHFLATNEPRQIEKLTLQTATVDGIYSVLVTDLAGRPISEVVNKNGTWSPRYSRQPVRLPDPQAPDAILEETPDPGSQRDFLAGSRGTLSAWHRIVGSQPLGWVRVNYRLDTFETLAHRIRVQAFKAIGLALVVTWLLLWLLLRPMMRALRQATAFASQLDRSAGAVLKVSHQTSEIAALGQALNVVSARLLVQNLDLNNQKFALDQHAIVSITNLQGNITYANQRFCDVSGYRQDELLGQNHRIIKSDEHPPALFEDLWRTITEGKVWRGDIKNRTKSGGFYWVNATIVPLLGVDGLPHQFIGIRTDITVNKNLEQSLQFAKDQAESAAVAKGQFLANMSHEIRTPMNAVLGMLRLMHNTPLTERQLDYASKAESAAQSLLGLLNDILDFSKIDAGKMTLEVHPFRLDKLLRDLSVIVSANVGNKDVEVLFDVAPDTPQALCGDMLRLHQVLLNLCSNAVKFTPRGDVVVAIRVVRQTDQDATLHFAVTDTGIGIAPENQQHIFEGFSQAEASTTRRFGGTGLGLSICRRLVALMGGELALQSELGQGSTFSFQITLPISPELQPPVATQVVHVGLSGLRVLLVDDNPIARDVLAALCRALGWQVDVAADGAQALAMLQPQASTGQMPYQVLLMDWHMPGMDGWQTLEKWQALSLPPPAPAVIMITSSGRDMLTQRSPQQQALLQGFLVKPVTASMLLDAVSDALARSPDLMHPMPAPLTQHKPLAGRRLLVVEDNAINQQVAQEMLTNEGAEVVLADNGQLGVAAVRQAVAAGTPFDAVLMDIQMPVMDGYAATRAIRETLGLRQLPIIAMTANAMAADRAACLAAGMNDHVGKPFRLGLLTQLILHPTPLATATDHTPGVTPPDLASTRLPGPPPATALPPEGAVDSVAALERLGGNQALYVRVLRAFLSEITRLPEQFDAQLAAANLITAERMLHTLKGLASTVGAVHLAAVAHQAQVTVWQTLDKNQPLDALSLTGELYTALATTQTVLERVAASLEQTITDLASTTPTPLQPLPSQGGADTRLLQEWLGLLKASDMRAVAVFDQLRDQASSADPVVWQALQQAMDDFDFERASRLGRQLLQTTHHKPSA
ncbi:response regulator [Rhodoferax sp. U2-2l]|uniref:PAS domain-containing hybrid sensor histidine kinase/response regulator n=1 Tax=Rhodoferax sp. U2-2l TaxID=2884000 RepID=UPI001D0B1B9E|nr:response regulator [Rhodoferax sp. U2-2l]MCB8746071.1 response regulator [Rhodoferax sp. U2-2l]